MCALCVRCPSAQCALRVRVYANCRVRRLFLSDREYSDWELPPSLRVKPPPSAQSEHGQEKGALCETTETREQSQPAERIAEVMVL